MSDAGLTERGRATRDRILDAAADLTFERGVNALTLDDVRERTGTSKSQLFHYFPGGRSDLVHAVTVRQTDRILEAQQPLLESLDTWERITAWADELVALQDQRECTGGCPLGSLASGLAETDDMGRQIAASSFERWQSYLVVGLTRMRDRGDLVPQADPETLALAMMASLQGGLLLTQTSRTTRPLRVALDAALRHLRTFAAA